MSKAPTPPATERRLCGQVAAPGTVRGVTHLLPARPWQQEPDRTRSPATEGLLFDRAVAELGAGAGREDIPLSPLLDRDFLTAVREAIAGGEPAGSAFGDALDIWCADKAVPLDKLTALRRHVVARLGTALPEAREIPAGAIILVQDLTPTRFLEIDWQKARGLVLGAGCRRDHVALLARARGVPLLIGLGESLGGVEEGVAAILDGPGGCLVLQPEPGTSQHYRTPIEAWAAERREATQLIAQPARTGDGTPIAVTINVDGLASIESVMPACCDGIGLVRSEFLLPDGALQDEEQQYRLYRALLFWAEGRPVTIRTLDAGGDKPVPGLSDGAGVAGLRGLALSLAHPDIFQVQLRALVRAAEHGPLGVLLPAVATPSQVDEARRLMEQARGSAALPPLGIMVETWPALQNLAAFDVEFFAIGSNDLERMLDLQYENKMINNNILEGVSNKKHKENIANDKQLDPLHDVKNENTAPDQRIMEAIEKVCQVGQAKGIPVSLCGELASLPEAIPALLKAGLRALSVPPNSVSAVKRAVAGCRL